MIATEFVFWICHKYFVDFMMHFSNIWLWYLTHLSTPISTPSTSPSFMCPKHIPSSHFIPPLHPSHVLKFISLYLSTLVSPPPSLHLAYLSAALLAQWQSHHTLSIRLVRPGRSAAQHCTVLVWSHQCQSVSLTLSVTLKRFRLPDIVCFPPPCHRSGDRVGWWWGGWGPAGVEIQLSAWFDITWHILWPVSALKMGNSSFKQRQILGYMISSNPLVINVKTSTLTEIWVNGKWCKTEVRTFLSSAHQLFFSVSYLPQASSCGWRLRKENCINKKDRQEQDRDE